MRDRPESNKDHKIVECVKYNIKFTSIVVTIYQQNLAPLT